jgi:hypothetical protein
MTFKILWGIDAIIALVFVYFFVVGLGDGSVSSFNMLLWISTLFTLSGVLSAASCFNDKVARVWPSLSC